MIRLSLFLLCLAGCSDDQHNSSDLSVRMDLSLRDSSLDLAATACAPPTGVPDPCILDVELVNYESLSLGGTLVEMRARSDDHVITSGNADSTGTLRLSAASGGKPIDAYLIAHSSSEGGVLPLSVVETSNGLSSGQLQILVESESLLQTFAGGVGVTWDTANELTVADSALCNTTSGLAGTAITISPGSTIYYADSQGPFMTGLTETTSLGEGASFNTPPGTITVGFTNSGHSGSYVTRARAGAFHYLYVYP